LGAGGVALGGGAGAPPARPLGDPAPALDGGADTWVAESLAATCQIVRTDTPKRLGLYPHPHDPPHGEAPCTIGLFRHALRRGRPSFRRAR
jgi:hypothetical protein